MELLSLSRLVGQAKVGKGLFNIVNLAHALDISLALKFGLSVERTENRVLF